MNQPDYEERIKGRSRGAYCYSKLFIDARLSGARRDEAQAQAGVVNNLPPKNIFRAAMMCQHQDGTAAPSTNIAGDAFEALLKNFGKAR